MFFCGVKRTTWRRFVSTVVADRQRPPLGDVFYSQEGLKRRYYYVIDTRGHLFLESTNPRSPFTCLKEKKFLNFFYRQLKPIPAKLLDSTTASLPYVSMCGTEINFVTPEDPISALVFTGLDAEGSNLVYGCGSMTEAFSPHKLSMSLSTQRIYHSIHQHKHLAEQLGLLHPVLAQQLASHITWQDSEHGVFDFKFMWKGQQHVLRTSP